TSFLRFCGFPRGAISGFLGWGGAAWLISLGVVSGICFASSAPQGVPCTPSSLWTAAMSRLVTHGANWSHTFSLSASTRTLLYGFHRTPRS
ncbi:hypothetical protein EDB85DRAFT_1984514, partial [Lactarius pseudohatsudake]